MPALYPLPATQPLAATLYTLALVICAAPECGRLLTRRHRAGATARDGGSLVLLLALLALSLISAGIAAWLLPSAAIIHGRVFVFGAGVALILIGTALRAYAIRALGRYFVITVSRGARSASGRVRPLPPDPPSIIHRRVVGVAWLRAGAHQLGQSRRHHSR